MSFVSFSFAFFVAAAVLLYYIVSAKHRYIVLLVFSYIYYVAACGKYVIYILVTTAVSYAASMAMEHFREDTEKLLKNGELLNDRARKKEIKARLKGRLKLIMILCLCVDIGILAVLKYSEFVFANINRLRLDLFGNTDFIGFGNLVIPLGISFYTFQTAGYIIDLYYMRYRAEKNPLKFALFVSFFPQIIQGPISRFNELSVTLFNGNRLKADNIRRGLCMILFGVGKKLIIADRLSAFIGRSVASYEVLNGEYMLLTLFLYSMQLYADFSGGINITIGVARLFGVEITENFNRPFFSKSVAEYWRRWHITLGTWFRDYIFYPISISKRLMKTGKRLSGVNEFFGKRFSLYTATIVVWTATGFWHGPEWRYIVWGLLNGIIMCVSAELEPLYEKINRRIGWSDTSVLHKMFSVFRTFWIMSLLRTFDLSVRGLGQAAGIFKKIFTEFGMIHSATLEEMGLPGDELMVAMAGVAVLFVISMLQRKKSIYDRLMGSKEVYRWIVCAASLTLIVIYGYYGPGYDAADFIYMQF